MLGGEETNQKNLHLSEFEPQRILAYCVPDLGWWALVTVSVVVLLFFIVPLALL